MAKPNVLKTLQDARHHIDTKWIASDWFSYIENGDLQGVGEMVPDGATVVGVCAAGSVLYALNYTDEQWAVQDDVKPVIEALYEALPPRSRAKQRAVRNLRYCPYEDIPTNRTRASDWVYGTKLTAVTDYNDTPRRRKEQIVALFDRAIENTRAQTPLVIQEMTP